MGGVEIVVAVAGVVLAVVIFCILQIRGLAKRSGAADAERKHTQEVVDAQSRRQRMALRARATGDRLLKRMQKWSRAGRS